MKKAAESTEPENAEPRIIRSFHPKDAREALERWDAGEGIFSVERGGLGPAYEQCIQVLFMELIRDHLGDSPDFLESLKVDETLWRSWGDETVHRLNEQYGFSGAQVGAAKQMAYFFLTGPGWESVLDSAEKQKASLIQIHKNFPAADTKRLPALEAVAEAARKILEDDPTEGVARGNLRAALAKLAESDRGLT